MPNLKETLNDIIFDIVDDELRDSLREKIKKTNFGDEILAQKQIDNAGQDNIVTLINSTINKAPFDLAKQKCLDSVVKFIATEGVSFRDLQRQISITIHSVNLMNQNQLDKQKEEDAKIALLEKQKETERALLEKQKEVEKAKQEEFEIALEGFKSQWSELDITESTRNIYKARHEEFLENYKKKNLVDTSSSEIFFKEVTKTNLLIVEWTELKADQTANKSFYDLLKEFAKTSESSKFNEAAQMLFDQPQKQKVAVAVAKPTAASLDVRLKPLPDPKQKEKEAEIQRFADVPSLGSLINQEQQKTPSIEKGPWNGTAKMRMVKFANKLLTRSNERDNKYSQGFFSKNSGKHCDAKEIRDHAQDLQNSISQISHDEAKVRVTRIKIFLENYERSVSGLFSKGTKNELSFIKDTKKDLEAISKILQM